MSKGLLLVVGLLLPSILLCLACTKTDPPGGGTPSATASAASTASVAASASAAPSASASASAVASADPAPSAMASSSAGASASSSAKPAGSAEKLECGTKPLPDCPLQAWMKQNMNPPVMTADGEKLAIALDKSVQYGPPGYTNWASIAKDAAKAAKEGKIDVAKQGCRGCHEQYKKKYIAEFRARKI